MPFIDANGARLHYEDGGEGPPLLLIAGIPAIADDWLPLAEPLRERGRRVIAFDNRGSGESETTPGPYTTALLADDAAALLDSLDAAPAHVFGMSLGGMIAQELALRHPQKVRRLVLGCTHSGFADAIQPEPAVGRAFAAPVDTWPERIELLAPFAFARGADPALVEPFIAKKRGDAQSDTGYRAQTDAVIAHDATGRLAQIAAPTLVITGDDDRVIPAANSERIADAIPNARLEVIAGAGHLFFLERPAETLAVLERFL
jgi:3-oxoadipate enol-lactonase